VGAGRCWRKILLHKTKPPDFVGMNLMKETDILKIFFPSQGPIKAYGTWLEFYSILTPLPHLGNQEVTRGSHL
jgi:hypothetical protein